MKRIGGPARFIAVLAWVGAVAAMLGAANRLYNGLMLVAAPLADDGLIINASGDGTAQHLFSGASHMFLWAVGLALFGLAVWLFAQRKQVR
ncbi:MAG: hypothetical protein LBB54_05385 [Cellulomonadaceae bacterium]|jgi:hypothetical protein|nr:hypothetical protein [Cellulomonadaceae bacterium]